MAPAVRLTLQREKQPSANDLYSWNNSSSR
jgi:hypothetical protein